VPKIIFAKHGMDGPNGQQASIEAGGGIDWSTFDRATLQAYRHAYRLSTPSSFTCAHNELVLEGSTYGRASPTMARQKDRKRVGKETLTFAVRKDFNAASVSEQEVITSFIYSVHNQDKQFKMKFPPSRHK